MNNQVYEPHKSSIGGMDANVLALLTYIASVVISWIPGIRYFAWLVPLIFFIMEKQSKLVKFHAMQSFILNAICAVLAFLLSVVVGGIVTATLVRSYSVGYAYSALGALGVISFLVAAVCIVITIFSIIAMVKAYGYKEYHIPLVGGLAEKLVEKFGNNG